MFFFLQQGESDEPRKPDREQLEKFREYRVRVMTMARVAIELFFYLTFAWALMVICYGRRDTGHYWMTNGIDELLPRFHKVRNKEVSDGEEYAELLIDVCHETPKKSVCL